MALASTHVDRSERLETGKRIFTDTIHMKPIASYKNGSLRRDPGVLSATGAADWPLGVDGVCDVRIAGRIAGKSPVLRLGHGNDAVTFALVGARNVTAQHKGNVTTFTNAWSNADLRYTYGGHKLQEEIILRANHPRSFAFIVQEHTGFDPLTLSFGSFRIQQPTLEKGDVTVPLQWLVTQSGGKWLLTCVLPAGDWAAWTVDPTLSLQPDAADGVDTLLGGNTLGTINYGTTTITMAGLSAAGNPTRGLIQFNVSSIGAGNTVSSATLTLECTTEDSTTDYAIGVHRALTQWYEGIKNGVQPDAGQDGSTWNLRNANGAVTWAGGAGGGSGTDFAAATTASTVITGTGSFTWSIAADVSAWVGGASNYGIWLIHSNEAAASGAKRFASSDHATAAYRPKLVIEYTLPGGGGIFASSIFHSAIHGQNLTR